MLQSSFIFGLYFLLQYFLKKILLPSLLKSTVQRMSVELLICRRFKSFISGENILLNQSHFADEKIVAYQLEARLGFLADLSKFVDCPSNLLSKIKNPWTCSLLLNLL